MSFLAQFARIYSTFLLVSHLPCFTTDVHAQAAPDFFGMDQLTTNKPLEDTRSPVSCGSPPNIQHGELSEDVSAKTSFQIGSVVRYKCITNYVNIPGTNNTATCMNDGSWSLPNTFCKANFCGSLPRLDYAEPQDSFLGQTMFFPNVRVTYKCRPGYSRVPAVRTFATCMDNGIWSPPGNFCKRRSCGNPGDVDNAEMKVDDFLFGSTAKYICDTGYRMLSRRDYRECLADGTWSNALPICQVQLCPQPPDIINGILYPIKEEYSYLDSVKYQCNRNMALIGESSISCREDGQWSSSPPECISVNCQYPYVNNARKISGISGPYNLNSVVRFRCDPGFVMDGSDTVKCNQNNKWEPKLPYCLGFCYYIPYFSYAELEEPTNMTSFLEGTTLKYKCKKGFTAVPGADDVLTCLGRIWSQNEKFCTPVFCGDPGPIDNGYVNKNASFYYGSNVTFACNTGYKLKDRDYRQCQADGSWSFPIPECEVQTCPSPTVSLETFIPVKTQYQYGDILNYSCHEENQQLSGAPQIACNHEGRWDPSPPSCKDICHEPPALEYATLSHNYGGDKTFLEDEEVEYTCKDGYARNFLFRNTSTCLENFEWSQPGQFCSRISCRPPENINNGVYEAKNFYIGSEVVYKCNKGYKMSRGNNSIRCLSTKKWSGFAPRCRVQTCQPPEDLVDGSYSPKEKIYTYQKSVTYKCKDLTLVGEASVSCTAEGTWTFGAQACKAVCKSPPELKYGELEKTNHNQYFNIGTSLTYKCRPGYISRKNISNVITCLDSLTWTEPEKFCTRLSCGNPGNIANGQMHSENFLYESRVNYTCVSGYTMISRTNYRSCQADGTWSGTPPVCKASICDKIWELQEEARECTSTPDDWIKYLQVQYLYLQIENIKLDIEIKKKKLNAEHI